MGVHLKCEIKILNKCHSYFTDLLKCLGLKKNGVLVQQFHLDIFFESKNKQKKAMHTFEIHFNISAALELKLNDTRVRTGFLL